MEFVRWAVLVLVLSLALLLAGLAPLAHAGWKDDFRTPVLGPIRDGEHPSACTEPPSTARILRALPSLQEKKTSGGKKHRDNIKVVTELIADKIDPPRFFPLVGRARLHRCHWKCTVYSNKIVEISFPVSLRFSKPRIDVVYIDCDHLHACPREEHQPPSTDETSEDR